MLDTGRFRERLTLQAPAPGAADARGHGPDTFVDVAEVWGAAEPLRGREFFAAGQQQAQVDVRFRIRYRAGVLASWRVLWRGVPYQLSSPPIDVGGQRLQLELMAAHVAGSGVAP
jgi:SPP1 family predicted phage head-tail adaptor